MNRNDRDLSAPIPLERSIVPYRAARTHRAERPLVRADACFLASLIASDMNAETVRSRRKAPAAQAAARYRFTQALTAA